MDIPRTGLPSKFAKDVQELSRPRKYPRGTPRRGRDPPSTTARRRRYDPNCRADKKPLMPLFTAFLPLTLHEKVTEVWIQTYQTQNAPIAQLYLNTLESTRRSSKVDPMNKHRRGALKIHAKKATRRKNDVGYGAREIDISGLDVSKVDMGRRSYDGGYRSSRDGGYRSSHDGLDRLGDLGGDAGAPRDADIERREMIRRASNWGGKRKGDAPASAFNSRASQIVSKHLAFVAVQSAASGGHEAGPRRRSVVLAAGSVRRPPPARRDPPPPARRDTALALESRQAPRAAAAVVVVDAPAPKRPPKGRAVTMYG